MNVYSCPVCGEVFENEDDGFVHVLTHPNRSDFEIERGVAVRVKRDQAAEVARLAALTAPPTPPPTPPSPLAEVPAPAEVVPEVVAVEVAAEVPPVEMVVEAPPVVPTLTEGDLFP